MEKKNFFGEHFNLHMITESIMHNSVGTAGPDPGSAGMPLRTSPMLQTCAGLHLNRLDEVRDLLLEISPSDTFAAGYVSV